MIRAIADGALWLAALPVLLAAGYLLLLTLFSAPRPTPADASRTARFDLIIPAHDEEAGIAATVRSLRHVDYPVELRRLIVVADNCRDETAKRAREAGAEVLERRDPERRGKGYALELAFERSLAAEFADAVVVVDADTVVSSNLLRVFSAHLGAGATAVQAHYRVRNAEASWRTRLMSIAFALFHAVRSQGRERLGLSAGLRGNGMCFTTGLLREVPHRAFSIVEDLEYGIRIGLAGHRVHYAAEAEALGDMVAGAGGSGSQRRRWEGGRFQMAREHALPLLRRAVAARSALLLDLALDLLVPPLAYLGAGAALGVAAAAGLSWIAGRPLGVLWAFAAALAALALYVARGWWLSGTGLRGLGALLYAPVYLAWKVWLGLRGGGAKAGEWVRTRRERGS
jgi:1,2-diacylglycerol 3-beta-glucosyltransferase